MSVNERSGVLAVVAASPSSKSRALAEMGIPRRTYYNWLRQEKQGNLGEGKRKNKRPWNKVKTEEEKLLIDQARASAGVEPQAVGIEVGGQVRHVGL